MIRILLIDDHSIVRSALKLVIKDILPDATIHEADRMNTIMTEIRKHTFDLIILDMNLREIHCYQIMREIRQIDFSAKILVFTMNHAGIFARHLLRQGASGFLTKSEPEDMIQEAITTVLAGKTYLPANLNPESDTPFSPLTDKEFEIMILLSKGTAPGEVAAMLNISPSTVTTHQQNIFRKLRINNKAELTQMAVAFKLWE